ncbi:hypothetical protein ACKWTF_014006 [Chironomus riparius]
METKFGPNPTETLCPNCGVTMTTKVSWKVPTSTHIYSCIIFIICFPLFWIFYCCDNDDIQHKCSACNAVLGIYSIPYQTNTTHHSSTHHTSDIGHYDNSHCHGDSGGGGDCGGGGGDSGGGGGSCD